MMRPALLTAFLITCAGFMLALALTTPRFETNDDVAMSMIAHGYGGIRTASPNLVFSNVLWGRLVQALPHLPAAPGYSIATYLSLFAAAWASLYFLRRLGARWGWAAAGVALVYAKALVFPQFTVNAGLLTAAALLGLLVFARGSGRGVLAAALLLAFAGYLVRNKEFAFVLLAALPLLPWRSLLARRAFWAGALLLAAAAWAAETVNTRAYQSPEWQPFNRLQTARLPYTDYGLWRALLARPDITEKYNFSSNDLELVANWFFVDPRLADPDTLNAMAAELGSANRIRENLPKLQTGLQLFTRWPLMPLWLAAAALSAVLLNRWPALALGWGALAGGLLVLSLMGRPGESRVYYPVVGMLALLPLARLGRAAPPDKGLMYWQRIALALVLAAASLWTLARLAQENRVSEYRINLLAVEAEAIPRSEVVAAWGASFSTQFYYPLFSNVHELSRPMYQMGVNTLNPNGVAYAEERSGSGFLARLTGDGLLTVASPRLIALLRTYCEQNLGGEFHLLGESGLASLYMSGQRCEVR